MDSRSRQNHRGKKQRVPNVEINPLVAIVESGPTPEIHGVVRWRLIDLAQWLYKEFTVSLDETTVGRELKKHGYVKLTARPRHHAQDTEALEQVTEFYDRKCD